MASASYGAASCSASSYESASIASSSTDGAVHTATSDARPAADDHRVLRPGDFRRVKSQVSLRSRPVSRVPAPESPILAAPSSTSPNHPPTPQSGASILPPDFDLVIPTTPKELAQRESGSRDTFGPWQDDADDLAADATELNEELLSVIDDESVSGHVLAVNSAIEPIGTSAAPIAPSAFSSPPLDAHATQLKKEAEHAWASYRPRLTPQQHNLPLHKHKDKEKDKVRSSRPSASAQPPNIPQRVTSLRRSSSLALSASLASNMGSPAASSGSAFSSPSLASSILFSPSPSSSHARMETQTSLRLTSSTTWAGFHRPYTASIISSTTDSSFPSFQHSFESGMRPLLSNHSASSTRPRGRLQRPLTAGSTPKGYADASDVEHLRPHMASVAFVLPDTSNLLSAEERRQQVRRTKKLTQMLGEEMLLATKTLNVESQSIGTSSSARRKQPRAQSMASGIDSYNSPASSPTLPTPGRKTRALSQKLHISRSHRVKSLDRAFPDMMQTPTSAPASLSRKAAAILGLPHPESSSAPAGKSAEDVLAKDEELDTLGELHSRPLIPSGLEEFNEPTPHVAQLAAFSAAALDETDSPTLPQDGPFRSSDRSTAFAMSDSRKLAAARDERRRRVAKMSRWLGEAVPAELIHSGADQEQSAVIRSTSAHITSQQASIEHSHDSVAYTPSEAGSSLSSSGCHGESEGPTVRKLQSFMSIDSSDDEGDHTPLSRKHRPLSAQRSPASIASGLPNCGSMDGYACYPEHDGARLSELASMLGSTRDPVLTTTAGSFARPPRSPARSRTSPSAASAELSPPANHTSLSTPAAFLDLSGSETDSSTADDEPHEIDAVYAALRRPHDRSLSKLSNFFGSTPQQIVREQAEMHAANGLGVVLPSLDAESWERKGRKVGSRAGKVVV